MDNFGDWVVAESIVGLVGELQNDVEDELAADPEDANAKTRAWHIYADFRRRLDRMWATREITDKDYQTAGQSMDQIARAYRLT